MEQKTSQDPVQRVIDAFKTLPGIGTKSAQRLAFHLIRRPEAEATGLAEAILNLKRSLILCSQCNNIGASDPCQICSDQGRDRQLICVVEEPFNILSIERGGAYRGLYHVLHGVISPINGIGPEELRLKNLFDRIKGGDVSEIIVATNPTMEGEATAVYLSKLIGPLGVRVSRIATGVPIGGDLEYADQVTISRAISARQEL